MCFSGLVCGPFSVHKAAIYTLSINPITSSIFHMLDTYKTRASWYELQSVAKGRKKFHIETVIILASHMNNTYFGYSKHS